MAPELVRSDRDAVGPATDVWALGVILYQALTDRLPFDGASLPELLGQLLAPSPTPPRQLAPDVPPELEALVLSTLSASPAARPRSGEAVAQALDAWLASPAAAGRRRPRRRGRRPVLLLAGLGATAAATFGAALVLTRSPPPVAATPAPVASAGGVGPDSRWPERDALIARGRAALDAGRWDEAIEALEQARALREGVRLLVGLAQAYLGRGDRERGDLEVARRCADRALELAPDDLQGRLERAAAASRLGDRAAALVDLERVLVLDPRSIRAHTDRFELLVGPPGDPLGLPGTPQEVFDAADAWLAVEPRALGPRLGRAKAFVALGDPRRAADDMTRAMQELGPSAALLAGRAGALATAGDLEGAIADCTSALALDPDHVGARVNRAACNLQLGRPDEALVDADAAVRLAPRDSVVRSNRSRMRLLARVLEGALEDADAALLLAPDSASARYNRAMALQALGRNVEARADLVGLARSPRPDVAAEALVDLALIDAQAGGSASALELLDEALKRIPRLARGWNLRAILRARLGQAREALDDHDKAIALAPRRRRLPRRPGHDPRGPRRP
jgi:tetratricopeptide (TPR) repeat protein